MSNGTPPPSTSYLTALVPQTGMPPNNVSRSREIIYDALQLNTRFVKNPFGPQLLRLSRMNHRW